MNGRNAQFHRKMSRNIVMNQSPMPTGYVSFQVSKRTQWIISCQFRQKFQKIRTFSTRFKEFPNVSKSFQKFQTVSRPRQWFQRFNRLLFRQTLQSSGRLSPSTAPPKVVNSVPIGSKFVVIFWDRPVPEMTCWKRVDQVRKVALCANMPIQKR